LDVEDGYQVVCDYKERRVLLNHLKVDLVPLTAYAVLGRHCLWLNCEDVHNLLTSLNGIYNSCHLAGISYK
jgi:hypothetical protein